MMENPLTLKLFSLGLILTCVVMIVLFIVFGLYAGAALAEVILLGRARPYPKTLTLECYIDLVKVLRRIEIQSESLLNYIYYPF